jgi:hypothetical protein
MNSDVKIDALLGRLNQFLFRMNGEENCRDDIKHCISQFLALPSVKWWLDTNDEYEKKKARQQEEGVVIMLGFKEWMQREGVDLKEELSKRGCKSLDKFHEVSAPRKRGMSPKSSGKIEISFDPDDDEPTISVSNLKFKDLSDLDGLLN